MTIKREKRIQIGGVELALAMGAERADRLRRSTLYRRFVRPAISRAPSSQPTPAIAPSSGSDVRSITRTLTPEGERIMQSVGGIEWYHSIDLPGGASTDGYVDHRGQV